ncbi:methyltransferase [Spongiactinospora sp. TRM90649]|uniref:DUF7059 domain-containing protein n=1 Tax=Spongiactinospora sp. TRM90649 TaxID=3031114 RepID=UPI0023F730C8|nr:methyltransferase [Spongiactinospora sp. TRM90649]MDF5756061.1 methyltransferase [Spongiactinospora sp. TRM90649]
MLTGHGYTLDGVRDRLGDTAAAALAREELIPALRATRDGDPLAALIRLWWLGTAVPEGALPASDGLWRELAGAGLVAAGEGGALRATVHLQPWETGGYVVSDRKVRPGDPPLRPDHVVGAGGASANLAQLVSRRPAGRALDLGTGCGVQVLHLANGRAGQVVATDVNPRALAMARLSWRLSGITTGVEAREGSMFDPVEDERFDLVVSNPPFVIAPADGLTYRAARADADAFCRDLVRRAPRHLAPGGRCHLLANWLHVKGEDWRDRVGGWLAETGCDGWAVQRDAQDPAEYVELWLRDSAEQGGPGYRARYDAWLDRLAAMDVTGIGFGWITLHASGTLDPVVRVEELTQRVELPVGGYVDDVLGSIAAAHRIGDDELLAARLTVADGVVEERIGPPGAEDPARILLRQTRGLCRVAPVGTAEAALAGVCDGDLPLGPLLGAIAELTGTETPAGVPEAVRSLVAEGFLRVP